MVLFRNSDIHINVSLIEQDIGFVVGKFVSPVGIRKPNPYDNLLLCLEFAIYQVHVHITLFFSGTV